MMRWLLIVFTTLGLLSCANPSPPSGGPRDTIPPEIQSSLEARTLNVQERSFTFTFSEWVDREAFSKAFSVTPMVDTELNWSGREVEVVFLDSLKPETTYVLDIAPSFRDLRGNRIRDAVSIPFSTGSSIDSMKLSGQVVSRYENTKVLLYDAEATSDGFEDVQPEYRQLVGRTGQFAFQALKDKVYRIVVLDDVYADNVFTPFVDAATLGEQKEYVPTTEMQEAETALFWLNSSPDTLAPSLRFVRSETEYGIRLFFSEPIVLNELQLRCMDSVGREFADMVVFANSDSTEVSVHNKLWTKESSLIVQVDRISDVSGNTRILNKRDTVSIGVNQTILELSSPRTQRGPLRVEPKTPLQLVFTAPISVDEVKSLVQLTDADSNVMQVSVAQVQPNTWSIQPVESIDYSSEYSLALNWPVLNAHYPTLDTLFVQSLRYVDPRDLGTLKVNITDSDGTDQTPYEIMLFTNNGALRDTRSVKGVGQHTLHTLPTGTYSVRVVRDVNRNGKYDQGSVELRQVAEAFRQTQNPIVVKERWITEGVNIVF